jgi:hypothetical protein
MQGCCVSSYRFRYINDYRRFFSDAQTGRAMKKVDFGVEGGRMP